MIGSNNTLPWSLPGDLKHFRALTMGKPVLMGRRTYDSIGRPLPGRFPIVLSRDDRFAAAGVVVVRTLEHALEVAARVARDQGSADIMVAGGGSLYAALMGRADRLYVTDVETDPEGDTLFPAIDAKRWREVERSPPQQGPRDAIAYSFVTFERADETDGPARAGP